MAVLSPLGFTFALQRKGSKGLQKADPKDDVPALRRSIKMVALPGGSD
jgi:hypothetical protein